MNDEKKNNYHTLEGGPDIVPKARPLTHLQDNAKSPENQAGSERAQRLGEQTCEIRADESLPATETAPGSGPVVCEPTEQSRKAVMELMCVQMRSGEVAGLLSRALESVVSAAERVNRCELLADELGWSGDMVDTVDSPMTWLTAAFDALAMTRRLLMAVADVVSGDDRASDYAWCGIDTAQGREIRCPVVVCLGDAALVEIAPNRRIWLSASREEPVDPTVYAGIRAVALYEVGHD